VCFAAAAALKNYTTGQSAALAQKALTQWAIGPQDERRCYCAVYIIHNMNVKYKMNDIYLKTAKINNLNIFGVTTKKYVQESEVI
jgi:hypothetical protein